MPPPPEEPPRERSAGLVLAVAGSRPPLPGQHSSRRPFASKTLKNITEAPSYSKWIAKAPLVLQTRAISLQPQVMKTSPGATTATSASVARVLQPACCSQSSRSSPCGMMEAKKGGRRIQD